MPQMPLMHVSASEGPLQYEGRRKDGSKLGNLSCSQPSKLCKNFGKISRLLVYFSKHLVVLAKGFPSQTARIRGGPFSWIGSLHFCQVSTQAEAIKSDSPTVKRRCNVSTRQSPVVPFEFNNSHRRTYFGNVREVPRDRVAVAKSKCFGPLSTEVGRRFPSLTLAV